MENFWSEIVGDVMKNYKPHFIIYNITKNIVMNSEYDKQVS